MKISSFDIFDTCLVRKCGTPENFFDVFSLRAFNETPTEILCQNIATARWQAEGKLLEKNPYYTLQDIWTEVDWSHPSLKSKKELCELEQELEREMLVPVLAMRDKVNECRQKGDKIIFISDMYLSSTFLIEVMRAHGFYQDGDSLYVSCECNSVKWNGGLFQYVKEKECITSFRHWHHYGDHRLSDYKAPKKFGIKCTLIHHEYTPYQKQWKENDYSFGLKYPSIMAGLGRALHYSTIWTEHTDFVVDIIAPIYCSWIYQVFEDAQNKKIKRLYFCARDAYQIHKIAQVMQPLFPEVGIEYVYMSRDALYDENNTEAKIAYYRQIGLATTTDKIAIVDTTTSGKTLQFLNELLETNGFLHAYGYYLILWDGLKLKPHCYQLFNYQIDVTSTCKNINYDFWSNHLFVYENFFALNNEKKTINYKLSNNIASPVFEEDAQKHDAICINNDYWVSIHEKLLVTYAKQFISIGLGRYSSSVFKLAFVGLCNLFKNPHEMYVCALQNFYSVGIESYTKLLPYVVKQNILAAVFKLNYHTYWWRKGTLVLSVPNFKKIKKVVKELKQ